MLLAKQVKKQLCNFMQFCSTRQTAAQILLLVFRVLVMSHSGCVSSQVSPDGTFVQLSNYHETVCLALQMQQFTYSQTVAVQWSVKCLQSN